ncbi:MAG: NAD-dependent epimerase/dehydratase family protein [Candidatus Heimdallarchaeota archaeon]
MRILVAGGAGFIGSHLVEYLIKEKNYVIVLDDFSTGDEKNLPINDKLELFECDITEKIPLLNGKMDLIYHLASPACPIIFKENPEKILNVNDLGTRNLIKIALKNNSRFVYTSSSEIYGMQENDTLIKEDNIAHLFTNTSRSCYATAKRFAEEIILAKKKNMGLDASIVRLFNVYGPRMDEKNTLYGRVIPNFIKAAIENKPLTINGDGKQVRSFSWIDDVIKALWLIGKLNKITFDVVNVGKPDPIKIIDLAHLIIKLTKSKSELQYRERDIDDTLWRCPNIDRIGEVLNWKPKTSLETGLMKLISEKKNKGS